MRNTRRIKRMSRNRMKITKMNLTSLMDVFTILVFFLLVNSGSVEVLDTPKDVKLPEGMVEEKPRETVVICHHGIRSRQVAMYLDYQGFDKVINLAGGVAQRVRDAVMAMPTFTAQQQFPFFRVKSSAPFD